MRTKSKKGVHWTLTFGHWTDLLRLLLPFCYGFVTARTPISIPFYRCVTGVTALEGGKGNMSGTGEAKA